MQGDLPNATAWRPWNDVPQAGPGCASPAPSATPCRQTPVKVPFTPFTADRGTPWVHASGGGGGAGASQAQKRISDLQACAEAARAMLGFCLKAFAEANKTQRPVDLVNIQSLLGAADTGMGEVAAKIDSLYDILPPAHGSHREKAHDAPGLSGQQALDDIKSQVATEVAQLQATAATIRTERQARGHAPPICLDGSEDTPPSQQLRPRDDPAAPAGHGSSSSSNPDDDVFHSMIGRLEQQYKTVLSHPQVRSPPRDSEGGAHTPTPEPAAPHDAAGQAPRDGPLFYNPFHHQATRRQEGGGSASTPARATHPPQPHHTPGMATPPGHDHPGGHTGHGGGGGGGGGGLYSAVASYSGNARGRQHTPGDKTHGHTPLRRTTPSPGRRKQQQQSQSQSQAGMHWRSAGGGDGKPKTFVLKFDDDVDTDAGGGAEAGGGLGASQKGRALGHQANTASSATRCVSPNGRQSPANRRPSPAKRGWR